MIIVYHDNKKVDSIFDHQRQENILVKENHILKTLMHLSSRHSDRILVWCRIECKALVNYEEISDSFKIKNTMISYGNGFYLPDAIGYVENSPFINVNTSVKYPSWLMHSAVGAIFGSTLLKFKNVNFTSDFNYDLNSIAKLGMANGLFCYSEPKLLWKPIAFTEKPAGLFALFRFVKQHYRTRWVLLLSLNFLWHERTLTLLPLLYSLFCRNRKFGGSILLETLTTGAITRLPSIDVIIPTIGRANYVHDVLKDLAQQTHLPHQVIIVEQNLEEGSKTALDFIYSESWPFKIDHHFIHQTGACNARNLALKHVVSDYVYLADDDNKFGAHIIEQTLNQMLAFNLEVVSMSYLQKNEVEHLRQPMQWPTFGAGCSIMKSSYLESVSFNMALEFGYGEDVDFGMQLRNNGADIIYLPHIPILHLKAPIGGFRSTFKQPWIDDADRPKPAPTVMLNNIMNKTKWQILGYKTQLCINYYFVQEVKNPLLYFKKFNKQWDRSIYWANVLNK
ncbi:glycosyltransferase family 2 protein [Gelidibacter salicanalis]|uniref:Glycosyltransferase family 2 protein n=1 Tax=Gelidibacter salicanalis TaxID=291193 RepID=A0A5C7AAP1_9FLAO|nr:glycosyltransferase family A protein [Gelidibacter salicanalis]TXE05850.1 glycosyltransferase family 2 protein [Gelidibacter salicanalis]